MTLSRVQVVREIRKTVWLVVAVTLMITHLNSLSGFKAEQVQQKQQENDTDLLSVIEMREKIDQLSQNLRRTVEALPYDSQEQLMGIHHHGSGGVSTVAPENDIDNEEEDAVVFPYHVLFCLSGNHSGFLKEFQISLKSVLLNAPVDAPLDIHVLADQRAFGSLDGVFETAGLANWTIRNQISIHTYNAEPWLPVWKDRMVRLFKSQYSERYNAGQSTNKHTFGTMFRLFANDLLPPHVQKMVYLDPDAVVMANLQRLWTHLVPEAVFQWGENLCAGFMVLDNSKLAEVWELASKSDLMNVSRTFKQGANDQLVFMAVNATFPERVAFVDKAWDIHVANGGFRFKKYEKYLKNRPEVGMMHFNGGAGSKESAYEVHSFLKGDPEDLKNTWGLVQYYARMPWEWAKYWASGTIPVTGHAGYPLVIESHEDILPVLSSEEPKTVAPTNHSTIATTTNSSATQ